MSYRRPEPSCYGCQGTGEMWWHGRTWGICSCVEICDNHLDLDAPPCDPEECPLDPAFAHLIERER